MDDRNDLVISVDGAGPAIVTADPGGPGGSRAWVERQRDRVRRAVLDHGAVLIRGLDLGGLPGIDLFSRLLSTRLVPEREGFAPRDHLRGGLYSSSKWPPDQSMCMHHELSYSRTAPGTLIFACRTAPERGGVTALADAHAVLEALPTDLVDRFEAEGWWLDRSYSDDLGVAWSDAFGTSDREAVEGYCRANGIRFTWTRDGLRTRQRCPAVVTHPVTGHRCWFNQIAFLNEQTMDPAVRDYLLAEYGPEGLPFNTRFGNGDPIDASTVDLINKVYEQHTVREPWRANDLMVVDNVRTAHSREPYQGARDVVVALADPFQPSATDHPGTTS